LEGNNYLHIRKEKTTASLAHELEPAFGEEVQVGKNDLSNAGFSLFLITLVRRRIGNIIEDEKTTPSSANHSTYSR
jgi:uncharacterized membrane protein